MVVERWVWGFLVIATYHVWYNPSRLSKIFFYITLIWNGTCNILFRAALDFRIWNQLSVTLSLAMMFCYSFLVWHSKLLGVDICLQQNVYVPSEIMVFRCPFQPSGVVFTSAPCVSCEDSIVRCRILPFPAGTFPLSNIPSCSTIH